MSISAQTADAQFATARTLHREGRLAEAEHHYRAVIAMDRNHTDAKEWLGALCLQRGSIDEAVRWLSQAANEQPGRADFHDNLAAALLRAQRPAEAVSALEQSVAAAPERLDARVALGDLLLKLGRRAAAMTAYDQAMDRDVQLRTVCRDIRGILNEDERAREILHNCRHILARYPNHAPTHFNMAKALLNLGQIAEARQASERALVIDPTVPAYYHVLIHTGDPAQNANAVATLEMLERSKAALDDQDRSTLHFLLAKAYDDRRRYDDAFAQLQQGNAIKRNMIAYDEAHELGRMQAIAETFPRERCGETLGAACQSELPIFVFGMPRSGTTLVEQILASHPDVHGPGECTFLADLIASGAAGPDYPARLGDEEQLRRLGEAYVKSLKAVAPGARHVVDKMPYNFLHAGLIHMAMPKAHMIHVRREAVDTCFSCYSQTFAGTVGFAYDLEELARYYRAYDALMTHWRRVLPDGAILEVHYEEMVGDLPGQTRRLVEFCNLAWNARCLEFHKTQRAVATASLYQVRQPIYRSAVGRARAYYAQLAPLRAALESP